MNVPGSERSAEERIVRGRVAAEGRGCLLTLVAIPVALFTILAPFALAALVPARRGDRTGVLIAGLGSSLILFSLGMVWIFRTIVGNRARRLDASFVPLGLTGQSQGAAGRYFSGELDGRRVDVFFLKGPLLQIHVAAACAGRLAIGFQSSLAGLGRRLAGAQELVLPLALQGLAGSTHEQQWGQQVIAGADFQGATRALLAAAGPVETRVVSTYPGGVLLTGNRVDAADVEDPAKMHAAVGALLAIARAVEAAPVPAQPATAYGIEGPGFLRKMDLLGPGFITATLLMPVFAGAGLLLFGAWISFAGR